MTKPLRLAVLASLVLALASVAQAGTLISGNFASRALDGANIDSAALTAVDASISSTFSDISSPDDFLSLVEALNMAVPDRNHNTDGTPSWEFDFTTLGGVSITDTAMNINATTSAGGFHSDQDDWDYVRMEILDAGNVLQGTLQVDMSTLTVPDGSASLAVSLTGPSINLATAGTYTARFSSQALADTGSFFGTETFAINGSANDSAQTAAPEPSACFLFLVGLVGLALRRRRQQRA